MGAIREMKDRQQAITDQAQEAFAAHQASQQMMVELLTSIRDAAGPGLQTFSFTDTEVNGGLEVDFPVPGAERWLLPRLATGGTLAVPESLVLLLPANNRRVAGTLTNAGERNARLFLATAETAGSQGGLGTIFLGKNGGSWDFRLGSALWCGSICAIGLEGETTIDVVEV